MALLVILDLNHRISLPRMNVYLVGLINNKNNLIYKAKRIEFIILFNFGRICPSFQRFRRMAFESEKYYIKCNTCITYNNFFHLQGVIKKIL